jgi:hypothetical protein
MMAGSALPVTFRLTRTGRAALRGCALAGMAAVATAPDAADSASAPGLEAALAACAAPGRTLSERVAGLTDAGWLQATPSDAARDRMALAEVAEPLFQGRPLAGAGLGSLSDQFQRARDRRLPVMPAPGTPVDAGSITDAVAGGAPLWAGTLSSDGVDGDLVLLVSPERGSTTEVGVDCRFFLSAPVSAEGLDALVPADTAADLDAQGGGAPAATFRRLVISLGDGAILRLTHADLTTAPDFTALMAEVGAVAPLATLITVQTTNVPLR